MPFPVDVVDSTGDPALAAAVLERLDVPGLLVGTLTTAPEPAGPAIRYPADAAAQAELLAWTLDATELLEVADVPHVTLVLGPRDAGLVDAVLASTGLGCVLPAGAEPTA